MDGRPLTAARARLGLNIVIYRFTTDVMARDVVVYGSQMYADVPRVLALANAMLKDIATKQS